MPAVQLLISSKMPSRTPRSSLGETAVGEGSAPLLLGGSHKCTNSSNNGSPSGFDPYAADCESSSSWRMLGLRSCWIDGEVQKKFGNR